MTTDVAQIAAAARRSVEGADRRDRRLRVVGLLRRLVGRIAYAVWVEADPELRLARGMARDTRHLGKRELWERWMIEEEAFFAADGTRGRADLVTDTSAHPVEPAEGEPE